MVNFLNTKSVSNDIEQNNIFNRSKLNNKRCSLRNFKNWTPFNDNAESNEPKKTVKDEFLFTSSGIVKRMADTFSSQLTTKSHPNPERPRSNILPNKSIFKTTCDSNSTKNTEENSNSQVKVESSDLSKVKRESTTNESNESNNSISNLYLKETVNGINIQIQEPHLILVLANQNNTINQSNKTSIKIYPIKPGKTTIGSSNKNDIVINGPGIESEHCFIERDLKYKSNDDLANKDSIPIINYRRSLTTIFRKKTKDADSSYSITLNPLAKLCALDGVLIESRCSLTSGSVICLGESEYFRFNCPSNENKLNHKDCKQSIIRNSFNEKSTIEHSSSNLMEKKFTEKNQLKENMLSNQKSQLITLDAKSSDNDLNNKDPILKDNDDRKSSKVRFNIPEKIVVKNDLDTNSTELNKKSQDKHAEKGTKSEKKLPSKTFLSKINKFELLSRGLKPRLDDSNSNSSQSDLSSCSIKITLNNKEVKMLRQNLSKKEFLKVREVRSKSFGCEKDFNLKKKQKKSSNPIAKSNAKNDKSDSVRRHFNIDDSINYIDDDTSQSNDLRANDNDSDDYDDDVIYEGDSADELNDFLEDDFDTFDLSDSDSDTNEIIKCRSAPISPSHESKKRNHENDKSRTNGASFIYDVNLYNDQHNLVILNSQAEFKKNLKKLEKNSNDNSTESCSSTSSIDSMVRLEPLIINEENSVQLTCTTSTNKITIIPVNKSNFELNLLSSTSTSSTSTSDSKEVSHIENCSSNSSLKEMNTNSPSQNSDNPDKPISPSSSSQSSTCSSENEKNEQNETNVIKNEDLASLSDENSQSSSSNMLSESQYYLKDNYEKAKREREIEQQLAEMEKKRLQEILDICLEFQKQEQIKQVLSPEQMHKSSTSSSISSTQNEKISISDLPSLNKILNSNQTRNKGNTTPINRTNSNSPNQEIVLEYQHNQQKQLKKQQIKNQIDKLSKEKCDLISSLNSIKQKIKDIEMRQNEALRDLEMERALLDVEQTSELKLIQSEENKIKHLHQEHQLKLEAFNMHTNQIRNEIKIVQMTIKNIENEILILDTTLDTNFLLSGNCLDSTRIDWENLKTQKEHALDEARRAHEDLEFQLMELEAKYETELEDIQNRLIKEQEILIESFKQKQTTFVNYDQEQQKLILQVKSETEVLELERQNLIEQFQKQRNQLQSIEKKLQKISDYADLEIFNQNLESQENFNHDLQDDSPSPASSSVSLSSATNSSETNPSVNQQFRTQEQSRCNLGTDMPLQTHYMYPSIMPQLQQIQNQLLQSSLNQTKNNNYKKQLSQSFRDILENTLLINGISETNNLNRNLVNQSKLANLTSLNYVNPKSQRYTRNLNKSTSSLNNQSIVGIAANVSCLTGSNQSKIPISLNASQQILIEQNMDEFIEDLEKKLASPLNTKLAFKFAELERSLAMSKAENSTLLEQQFQARERELFLLQEEKRKRDELERQLNEEKNLRKRITEENIKLRDKKQTQARPLTRYLPVRDNNFDLKLHVENSGHNLLNQIDPNTKQPLIFINNNSCRGYLLKMGQKFKTWNKRWFVFDRNKRTLCYYMDKHETKLRGSIYFQSINEVYVDHMRTIKSPDSKSTFVVKTMDRNFYLVAPSSELMRIWIDVIFTGAEGYLEFIE